MPPHNTDQHAQSDAQRNNLPEPRFTNMGPICDQLRDLLEPYNSGRTRLIDPSEQRDHLLQQARDAVTEHIAHDVSFNIAHLRDYAQQISAARSTDVLAIPLIASLFDRLEELRVYMRDTDPYSKSSVEEQVWLARQQFYCDALELAERLCDIDQCGRLRRKRSQNEDGTFKRFGMLGLDACSRLQLMVQASEVLVPNVFETRLRRTLLPSLAHVLWHQIYRWGRVSWSDFERSTLGWLGKDGFSAMRGLPNPVVHFHGRDILENNPELFDVTTGKARHNLLVVGSHRIGFLDFPFFNEALRKVPHGVWANNSFYGKGMGQKLAKEKTTIPVRGFGVRPMNEILDRTVDLMAGEQTPLFIMGDGSQPNLMYGHQIRQKSGMRLIVDECIRRTAHEGRKTYVIPMSYNDPVSYVRGLTDEIIVTVHPPIEINKPSTDKPYTSHFDKSRINGGDDLISHLEALFMLNSMQPRFGLTTPDVLGAVRWKRSTVRPKPIRQWLRSKFNTAVSDLSRWDSETRRQQNQA